MTPQMKKMLLIVGIIFGIIFGIYAAKKAFFLYFISHYTPPPVTISAAPATNKTWESFLTSVGTLTAVNGTDISAEIPGKVVEIRFASGQFVQQGDVLVVLDSSVEQAQLKFFQAKLALAQLNFNRKQPLVKTNVLSRSDFDAITGILEEAKANIEETRAKIQQKIITAPFSGKIGISLINLGQFVSAGTTMATLQALDPLYVRFNLPEQYLSDLNLQQPIEITINQNASGTASFKGVITAINAKIDQATRSILVQATIPNKELQLYPGMFAQVKIFLPQQLNVITLPQTSISYSLHGDSVFLIQDTNKNKKENRIMQFLHHFYKPAPEIPNLIVNRQYVTVGERRGDEVAIVDGVKENDQVATSGQLKLQNGTHVMIDNSVEP